MEDPTHPAHGPFAAPPSGKRSRSMKLQPASTLRMSEELHTSVHALSSCCLPLLPCFITLQAVIYYTYCCCCFIESVIYLSYFQTYLLYLYAAGPEEA